MRANIVKITQKPLLFPTKLLSDAQKYAVLILFWLVDARFRYDFVIGMVLTCVSVDSRGWMLLETCIKGSIAIESYWKRAPNCPLTVESDRKRKSNPYFGIESKKKRASNSCFGIENRNKLALKLSMASNEGFDACFCLF